jgi:hypothetical protein
MMVMEKELEKKAIVGYIHTKIIMMLNGYIIV